jgi:tRNA 2-selenouridine synthase
VNSDLAALPLRFRYVTLCGCTGTGKTALLHALSRAGAQVIDLEGLANHRGSLLGATDTPQPSQKRFDTLLWNAVRALDATRPVFVESESKKIGLVQMPEAMRVAMKAGECAWLDVPLAARVAHIRGEYANFVSDPHSLVDKLEPLKPLRGAKLLNEWRASANARDIDALFASLMVDHYDPLYTDAIKNNYAHLQQAASVRLDEISITALDAAAHMLRERFDRHAISLPTFA